MPPTQSVFVCWLPYLTLAYPHPGPAEYIVGEARIVDDNDVHWRAITGQARPKHLAIHEDFPHLTETGLSRGKPLHGTLVTSRNPEWLRHHIDAVTAVIFFLADIAADVLPAECFTTLALDVKPSENNDASDLISFIDKHSRRVESSQNLFLLPPIAVRGNLRRRRLCTEAAWAQKLLRIVAQAPENRLVVAVRQYFRTQFSDPFTSPEDEDYALHCSAIEAALDIDRSPGIGERFAKELATRFDNDSMYEDFFLGLHKARSIFIHGVPEAAEALIAKETRALQLFRRTRWKLPLLRMVSQAIIREAIAPGDSELSVLEEPSAKRMLRTCLYSDAIWRELKRLLTAAKAKDRLIGASTEKFRRVTALAIEAGNYMEWDCVTEDPSDKAIFKAIETCARVVFSLSTKGSPTYDEAHTIGTAAHERNADAVQQWFMRDPWELAWPSEHNRLATSQSLARALALRFDRARVARRRTW